MVWLLQMTASSDTTIEDLADELSSSASSQEKTNFLIDYLMAQRGVVLDFLKTLLVALIVYLIGRHIVKFCLKLTRKWMEKHEVEISVRNFIMSFAKVVYHLLLIFVVAWILGIGATIVAVVGSAGLAIGLALQGSLSNLAGGVLILLLKPFKAGDYIVTAGVEGTVQSIDIFYTKIITLDNKVVMVPNGTVTAQNITNTTNEEKRKVLIDFMVSYDTDTDRVRELLFTVMREEPLLCQEEPMEVVISRLAPVHVQMQLRCWAETQDYSAAVAGMNEKIKKTLQEHNISIS